MNVIDLAFSRRAELIAEIERIDIFLDTALRLLDGSSARSGKGRLEAVWPFDDCEVVALRRPVRPGRPGATACGTGA